MGAVRRERRKGGKMKSRGKLPLKSRGKSPLNKWKRVLSTGAAWRPQQSDAVNFLPPV